MNQLKSIFKTLKGEGVNSMFQEFNRQLVLGISTGDNTPKPPDTIGEVLVAIQKHRNELKHAEGDVESEVEFLRPLIESCESYRHCFIEIPSYGTVIDYFVVKGVSDHSSVPAKTMMSTVLDRDDNKFVVHAIMVIFEGHDCVTDDSLGKIVKHELTHVLLEVMEFVLGVDIDLSSNSDDAERRGFQEFLCDYIQCDSTVGPNEHPVAKFREMMKKHLTWVAADVYEPYLKIVEEYYAEEEIKKETAGN